MNQPPTLSFGLDDPTAPGVRALIEQLDGYLSQLYPDENNHLPPAETLKRPHIAFVTARVDGEPVACGACVDRGDYVELTRMYVVPACRGLGLGRQLLEAMEAQARSMGLALVRLETGVAQTEALELYEHAGYRRCLPFGEHNQDPLSVFMEKPLA